MAINIYLSTIIWNANGFAFKCNAPIKRHMKVELITKQYPYKCYLWETHFRSKYTYRLKVKQWKKLFHEVKINKQKSWDSNIYTTYNRL